MGQTRVQSGKKNELDICASNGWINVDVKPKLDWSGIGRSNIDKIYNAGFDPSKFIPTDKSTFNKYDAITKDGKGVEIKKYTKSKVKNWTMYSEPVFTIKTRSILAKAVRLFGNGDITVANKKYNDFLNGMVANVGQEIIDKMTSTSIGIQLEDGFIPQDNIEYRWKVNETAWGGFNRLCIEFRVK